MKKFVILVTFLLVIAAGVFFIIFKQDKYSLWLSHPESGFFPRRIYKITFSFDDRKLIPGDDYHEATKPEKVNSFEIPGFEIFILEKVRSDSGKFFTVAVDMKKNALLLSDGNTNPDEYCKRFNLLLENSPLRLDLKDRKLTDQCLDFHLQCLFNAGYIDARGAEIFLNPQDNSLTAQIDDKHIVIKFKNKKKFELYQKIFDQESFILEDLRVIYNIIVKKTGSSEGDIYHMEFIADPRAKVEMKMEKIIP